MSGEGAVQIELIACYEIRADLPVAVMLEAEAFVNCAELWPRSFGVKAQIMASKLACAVHCPCEQVVRDCPTSKRAFDRETMNVGRFAAWQIGPEQFIFKLELHGANNFARDFRNGEQPAQDIVGDAFRQ